MKKLLVALIVISLFWTNGCSDRKGKEGENNKQQTFTTFTFKRESSPYITGFININETRYEMASGSFKWRKANSVSQTDAASPTQIAEHFKAITLEPASKITVEIEQNPDLSAYLWDSNGVNAVLGGNQLTVPESKGRYIYEVIARWSNGEVSYTFVVEVN